MSKLGILRSQFLGLLVLALLLQGCLGNGWGYPGKENGEAMSAPVADETALLPAGEYLTVGRCANESKSLTLSVFEEKTTKVLSVIWKDSGAQSLINNDVQVLKSESSFEFQGTDLVFSILAPTAESTVQGSFYINLEGYVTFNETVENASEEQSLLCSLSTSYSNGSLSDAARVD